MFQLNDIVRCCAGTGSVRWIESNGTLWICFERGEGEYPWRADQVTLVRSVGTGTPRPVEDAEGDATPLWPYALLALAILAALVVRFL
jgi:hypothetical protein